MDLRSTEDFEKETTRRALAGDRSAGLDALKLCRSGLESGTLSPILARYLAERLNDLLEGIKPDRALNIAKGPGKPPDPFPEWKQRLGAFAALLTQRGYKPKAIALAMCDARAAIEDKPLEESDAHRIRSEWRPMQEIDEERLQQLADSYWEILTQYPPVKLRV